MEASPQVSTLVGRDQPAAVLRSELDRTTASHGGLVLVAGEAGIGKSVLVRDLVDAARGADAVVATGTCWDREGAPGHWPWVQVVRTLARTAPAEAWAAARAEAGTELDAWHDGGRGDLGARPVDEFALHDSVTTLLVALARERPLVVVLEDLHWADPASLALLAFVARHGWYERLLLVGTYRDVEVEAPGHPLGPPMADLVARATTVTLTGLDRDDVARLVEATGLGAGAPPEAIDDLHRRTGGNPFFVEQTTRLWAAQGTAVTLPPGVRDAIQHRLALLPDGTRDALATMALIGHRTARPVLAAALAEADDVAAGRVAAATAARLVEATDDGWTFVHDLVRETLVADLDDPATRARHAALFERLGDPALDGLVTPGDRAHHAVGAGDRIDADRRVRALVDASRDAAGRMALDEAVGHLDRALDATDEPGARAFTTIELGWLHLRRGEHIAARRRFHDAATLALDLDDDALLTRACLSLRATVWIVADDDDVEAATTLVDEAHRRLVIGRGQPSTATTAWEREQELTEVALDMCRRSGDDRARWDALNARHDAIWTPGTTAARRELAEEMLAVARRHGDPGREIEARHLHLQDLVEAGDPAAHDELAALLALARRLDSAWNRALARWATATMAVLTADFDEARSRIDEVTALGGGSGGESSDVDLIVVQVRLAIELRQGRDDAVDALLADAAATHPHPDLLRALAAVERGDGARAAALVADLAAGPLATDRWYEPQWLRVRAATAALTGDVEAARAVLGPLDALRGEWVLPSMSVVDGPWSLWWAAARATAEPDHDPVADLLAAAGEADRLGARAWAVEARVRAAEAASRRPDPTSTPAGPDLDALATAARELGLARVVATVDALRAAALDDAGPAEGARADPSPSPSSAAIEPAGATDDADAEAGAAPSTSAAFRRAGDVWELRYAGATVHLPDAKGLRDLHALLGRPGMGVRAVDLLDPEAGAVGRAARSLGGDDVLDERAKASYRARLEQLDEAIEAAVARGDDDRAAGLDRERAALIDELRRATGLGGRSRRLGDDAERARKAVRERVRDTIRRITKVHPELGAHLDASVHTGATCSYEPDPPTRWER